MIDMPFSYNWNNKLNSKKAFTTIRIYNPEKHFVGQLLQCSCKGVDPFTGRIEAVKPFLLNALTPFMAWIDTGYSVDECVKIIRTMYKTIDFTKQPLAFILIVKQQS